MSGVWKISAAAQSITKMKTQNIFHFFENPVKYDTTIFAIFLKKCKPTERLQRRTQTQKPDRYTHGN